MILSTRDPESVALMGQAVADALQAVVRDATNVHSLILTRAVFYLFYLLNASQVSEESQHSIILLNVARTTPFFEHL